MEAFLVTKKRARREHLTRRDEMRHHSETAAILVTYHELEKASREARYDGTQPTFDKVRSAMRVALLLPP